MGGKGVRVSGCCAFGGLDDSVVLGERELDDVARGGDYALYAMGYVEYLAILESCAHVFLLGFTGTVALCLMVGLAAWPIRHRSYELFIILHIALGIISLAGCWYHMDFRFANKYGYKNWL